MNRIQQLTQEINEITLLIEENYPELYQYLDENPITVPSARHPEINPKNFSEYLKSLKILLKHHMETHA